MKWLIFTYKYKIFKSKFDIGLIIYLYYQNFEFLYNFYTTFKNIPCQKKKKYWVLFMYLHIKKFQRNIFYIWLIIYLFH